MDNLDLLMDGFGSVLTPQNLLFAAIGVLLGTFVGVLPGIGPAMAVALLLPVTYGLDPIPAFIMFAGIYYGGMYGGSTTAILLNTPGESASVMTALEGNLMAKAGRASQALATAAIGSFIAGTIGTLLVVFFAPALASVANEIGAPSYFALMVLAMVMVTSVLGGSWLRGFIALFLGLTIGLVGLDLNTGQTRLSFDQPLLAERIDVVVVAVGDLRPRRGLLGRRPPAPQPAAGHPGRPAVDEPHRPQALVGPVAARHGVRLPVRRAARRRRRDPDLPVLRHREEARRPPRPGRVRTAARSRASPARRRPTTPPPPAPSCRCSPSACPVTATSAVMLAALQGYGIQPGPSLMTDQPELVWALLASLLIGNALLLVLNLPLAPVWAKLLRIPRPQLYAGILFFATLGAYATNLQAFDLFLLLVLGLLGLMMRRFALPVLPLILGVILGPADGVPAPRGDGDLRTATVSALWSEPLAVMIYVIVALVVVAPIVVRIGAPRTRGRGAGPGCSIRRRGEACDDRAPQQ